MPLPKLALQPTLKVAFHGRCANPFPATQTASIDAVWVMAIDHFLKCFRGPLPQQNPRKAVPEVSPALPALPLAGFQLQNTMPQPPVLMPNAPLIASFVPQPLITAVRARSYPQIPRRDPDLPLADPKIANLIFGQPNTISDLIKQFLQECFTNQGSDIPRNSRYELENPHAPLVFRQVEPAVFCVGAPDCSGQSILPAPEPP